MIDTCGTGGAGVKTFNISTASALVAAGAGVYVAKHGNRGITSRCGSADVLDELGVNIDPGPDVVAECIREAHIGFMFAPKFHPAMRFVQPIRKSLDFRTAFNILGPLGQSRRRQGPGHGRLRRRAARPDRREPQDARGQAGHGRPRPGHGRDQPAGQDAGRRAARRLGHDRSSWTPSTTESPTPPSTPSAAATPSPTPP